MVADECLNRGEHPLNEALKLAASLAPGELIKITSSFAPVPLTDALKKRGYRSATHCGEEGRFETYFCGKND